MSPFSDIRALVEAAPEGDLVAMEAAKECQKHNLQAPDALGRLGEVAVWLARWQGKNPPSIDKPMVAVFASSHGVAKHGVSPERIESATAIIELLRRGGGVTNQVAAAAGAGMRVFEMALEQPTKDISEEASMSEQECAATIAFGMEAIAESPDLLALGETGVGRGTAAAAVACAMYGGNANYWVRAGDWVSPDILEKRVRIVQTAMQVHRGHLNDPLEILRRVGGRELAAMVGAIIAARAQGIPVLLDAFGATVAAALVHAMKPGAADHCLVGQLSNEPSHQALLDRLGQTPLLQMGLRDLEGLGAAVCIPILQSACAAHAGSEADENADWTRY